MWKQFKREWALWRDRFTICPLHIRATLLNFPAYVWGWGKVTSKLLISSRCDWPKTISARTSTRWEGLNYKEAKALCSTPAAAAAAASILWKIEVNQKIYEFRFAACSQLFPWRFRGPTQPATRSRFPSGHPGYNVCARHSYNRTQTAVQTFPATRMPAPTRTHNT